MIDNSNHTYFAVELSCGVEVMTRAGVLTNCPQILDELDNDIKECIQVLPKSVTRLVKRTKIWVNESYELGALNKPINADFATTHHDKDWLICAKDNPEKEKCIEIYNCYKYLECRTHWNGCGLILHEYCHLLHDIVLGLDNTEVINLFQDTYSKRKYLSGILRRDWAGKTKDTDKAYCMVNHKEFFAEMSVTFLSSSYPELDDGFGNGSNSYITMLSHCPPLQNHNVIGAVRKKYDDNTKLTSQNASLMRLLQVSVDPHKPTQSHQQSLLSCFFPRLCCGGNSSSEIIEENRLPHCNKFFPFTRGQLKHYDRHLYDAIANLWKQIEFYEDEDAAADECCFLS